MINILTNIYLQKRVCYIVFVTTTTTTTINAHFVDIYADIYIIPPHVFFIRFPLKLIILLFCFRTIRMLIFIIFFFVSTQSCTRTQIGRSQNTVWPCQCMIWCDELYYLFNLYMFLAIHFHFFLFTLKQESFNHLALIRHDIIAIANPLFCTFAISMRRSTGRICRHIVFCWHRIGAIFGQRDGRNLILEVQSVWIGKSKCSVSIALKCMWFVVFPLNVKCSNQLIES